MRVVDGVVLEFNEKPPTRQGFVSGGFFVLQRKFFDSLTPERELLFERAPVAHLARNGQLADSPCEALWMGMDTYRERSELNRP